MEVPPTVEKLLLFWEGLAKMPRKAANQHTKVIDLSDF
jgi:hypothetical protein